MMRQTRVLAVAAFAGLALACGASAARPDYAIRSCDGVVDAGFWFDRLETNRTATLASN